MPRTRHFKFVEKPMIPNSSWRGRASMIMVVRESFERRCFRGVKDSSGYFSMLVFPVRCIWRSLLMLRMSVVKCFRCVSSSGRLRHSLLSVSLFLSSREDIYLKGNDAECFEACNTIYSTFVRSWTTYFSTSSWYASVISDKSATKVFKVFPASRSSVTASMVDWKTSVEQKMLTSLFLNRLEYRC